MNMSSTTVAFFLILCSGIIKHEAAPRNFTAIELDAVNYHFDNNNTVFRKQYRAE